MRRSRYTIILFFAMFTFVRASVHAQSTCLTVITNQAGAPASMKQSELISIFMGEKQRLRNGKKIVIALMKTNTPAGKNVCEKIYDMSGEEVKKFWLALVFQ